MAQRTTEQTPVALPEIKIRDKQKTKLMSTISNALDSTVSTVDEVFYNIGNVAKMAGIVVTEELLATKYESIKRLLDMGIPQDDIKAYFNRY